MKPEIKLFFDFEFTSLSPDAQPISLGIVSEEIPNISNSIEKIHFNALLGKDPENTHSKSFYAEFSDFDLNRCDDWVKENVVGKLRYILSNYHAESVILGSLNSDNLPMSPEFCMQSDDGKTQSVGPTSKIKIWLKDWLSQFSDYNIQFVCDCGTWDWYWMLQLLDERKHSAQVFLVPEACVPDGWTAKDFIDEFRKNGAVIMKKCDVEPSILQTHQSGLPKLPENISPIPEDLNDLIAHKDHISVKEAFELNREELLMSWYVNEDNPEYKNPDKHNSLWDAKVIKAIYEKLTRP